ncbi:MAG: methyltransferase domain-containing protein [Pseudomonadota bacterium]
MHLDVLALRNFYYRTRLGWAARRAIREQVAAYWPETDGLTVAGFGFAVPLLRHYLGGARRVIALMPGQQGVMTWPPEGPNVSVLCEETLWPLEAERVDRLIVLHGLETSEHREALLNECTRVLTPGGKALFIVPNRGGLWSRRDGTPFGQGSPYSLGQLEAKLMQHNLSATRHSAALYLPPKESRFWLKTARLWERLGRRISGRLTGGILIVEVEKVTDPAPRPGLPEAVTRPLKILDGLAAPEPKPARVPAEIFSAFSRRLAKYLKNHNSGVSGR